LKLKEPHGGAPSERDLVVAGRRGGASRGRCAGSAAGGRSSDGRALRGELLVLEDAHAVPHPLERFRLPADQLVLGFELVAERRHVVRCGGVDRGEEHHSESRQAECAAQANPTAPGISQRSASSRRRQSTPQRRRPERREKPIRN
jgi:hypothetical protein